MSQECPKLRNACENCHKRKIRCQISVNEAACQNCAANGTACLFAPRVKTGRPRLVKTPSVSAPAPPVSDDEDVPLESRVEDQSEVAATMLLDDSSEPSPDSQDESKIQSHQPWLLEESSEHHDFHNFHRLEELQRRVSQSSASDLCLHGSHNCQSASSMSSLSHRTDNQFQSQVCMLTHSSGSRSGSTLSEVDVPPPDLGGLGLDFNAALRVCQKLERHLQSLQDLPYRPINTEAVLSDVDLACETVMQPLADLSIASSDASSALLIAALYKIFEICEAFIRRLSVSTPGQQDTQSAEHLLLLKRLDLVLLRAKIYLTRIGQHNAANKASRISFWIESLVKQQYQHWMW